MKSPAQPVKEEVKQNEGSLLKAHSKQGTKQPLLHTLAFALCIPVAVAGVACRNNNQDVWMVVRVPVQLMVRGPKTGLSNSRHGRLHAAA